MVIEESRESILASDGYDRDSSENVGTVLSRQQQPARDEIKVPCFRIDGNQ
jgi:hypothetical protein